MVAIQTKKKTKLVTIQRMAFYHMMKVVEAYDEQHQCYLLFYYKNQYLTYRKVSALPMCCRLKSVFSDGILINAPHPLIEQLITGTNTFTFQSFNQLLQKAEQHFSNQETSLIFSFFDSFIPKEKIISLMRNKYNQYRRNGQFFKAYQIIKVCLDYAPENSWARDMSHNLQYHPFETLYDEGGPSLLYKDPLYVEIHSFSNRHDQHYFSQLQEKLSQEGRWMDQILLYIDQMMNSKDDVSFASFYSLLTSQLKERDTTYLLFDLLENDVQIPELRQALIDLLIKNGQYEDAINVIMDSHSAVSSTQYHQVQTLLEQKQLDTSKLRIENMNHILVHETEPHRLEKMLRLCLPILLKKYDFSFTHQWLKPFRELNVTLPILKKVNTMAAIKDDPENQLQLGELYFEFQQFEQAIDCFSFEMELNPKDVRPIQWLAKAYRELGKKEESLAYQNILAAIQKRA